MSEVVNVQYVGFEAKERVREYSFVVRRALNQTSEFTLTIELESFRTGHVRFQDAAEICLLRLHRELVASGTGSAEAHYHISPTELSDYRDAHPNKAAQLPYKPTPRKDS